MEWVFILLLVVVALFGAIAISKRKTISVTGEYELNPNLFTPAERSFFGVLTQAVKDEAVIFGKVRVADVLSPAKGSSRSNWQRAFNKISAKHFDFVVCDPKTLRVLSVIELDDKSHANKNRMERDQLIELACVSSRLTLHRVKAANSYSMSDLRAMLLPAQNPKPPQEAIAAEPVPSTPTATSPKESGPCCPKCASVLVKKVAKSGQHKGSKFLACSAYPRCRYIQKIAA